MFNPFKDKTKCNECKHWVDKSDCQEVEVWNQVLIYEYFDNTFTFFSKPKNNQYFELNNSYFRKNKIYYCPEHKRKYDKVVRFLVTANPDFYLKEFKVDEKTGEPIGYKKIEV